MPLLVIRRANVGVDGVKDRRIGIDQRICGKAVREHVQSGNRAIHYRGVCDSLATRHGEGLGNKEGRIETGARVGKRTVFLAAIENSIAAAQRQLVRDFVRQTNPRSEIVAVRANQTRSGGGTDGNECSEGGCELCIHPFRDDQRLRGEVKSGLLVVMLLDGGEHFVAQTQIQGEPIENFPVILNVRRIDLPPVINVVQVGDGTAVRNAQQEGGEAVAARNPGRVVVGGGEFNGRRGVGGKFRAKIHGSTGGGGLKDRKLLEAHFTTDLQRMPAHGLGQVIGQHPTVLLLDGGKKS